MSLSFNEIDDAVLLTQENLIKKGAFLDLQTDLSDHVAVREMWEGRQKKFSGGHPWEFMAQIDHNHSARTVGLFEDDGLSLTDTMIQGVVEPRHLNASYIYDQREQAFNRGAAAIADLVYTRYVGMMVSFYELLEEILWGKPDDSADVKTPFGISYWVTRSATGGFCGGDPVGFAAGRAGISTTTQPRWANWSDDYAAISKEDLLDKMRQAHMETRFRSPVSHPQPDLGAMRNGIYANGKTVRALELLCEEQNMNLGMDLASTGGRALFKGTPITYAPFLDDDSEDPVYMLDWKWMAVGVLEGWEKQLSKPMPVPNKSKVRRVDLDATLQMVCTSLRHQAVLYNPA
jgi:hypothetical protein